MPLFEFSCRSCGQSFEELVGSHVGLEVEQVRCPACGAADVERLLSSTYAPVHRQLTPNEKRRLEDGRGIDRGGAKERFARQREAERRGRPGNR